MKFKTFLLLEIATHKTFPSKPHQQNIELQTMLKFLRISIALPDHPAKDFFNFMTLGETKMRNELNFVSNNLRSSTSL